MDVSKVRRTRRQIPIERRTMLPRNLQTPSAKKAIQLTKPVFLTTETQYVENTKTAHSTNKAVDIWNTSCSQDQKDGNSKEADENNPQQQHGDTAATNSAEKMGHLRWIYGEALLWLVLKSKCGDNCNVYVENFPGATSKDVYSFSRQSVELQPNVAILHIRTSTVYWN